MKSRRSSPGGGSGSVVTAQQPDRPLVAPSTAPHVPVGRARDSEHQGSYQGARARPTDGSSSSTPTALSGQARATGPISPGCQRRSRAPNGRSRPGAGVRISRPVIAGRRVRYRRISGRSRGPLTPSVFAIASAPELRPPAPRTERCGQRPPPMRLEPTPNVAPERRRPARSRAHRTMLLCVVKGQFRDGCWQTSDGPLGFEGGLLSGQAVSRQCWSGGPADRSQDSLTACWHIGGQTHHSDRGRYTPGRWR